MTDRTHVSDAAVPAPRALHARRASGGISLGSGPRYNDVIGQHISKGTLAHADVLSECGSESASSVKMNTHQHVQPHAPIPKSPTTVDESLRFHSQRSNKLDQGEVSDSEKVKLLSNTFDSSEDGTIGLQRVSHSSRRLPDRPLHALRPTFSVDEEAHRPALLQFGSGSKVRLYPPLIQTHNPAPLLTVESGACTQQRAGKSEQLGYAG
jgi:hypothetical protein